MDRMSSYGGGDSMGDTGSPRQSLAAFLCEIAVKEWGHKLAMKEDRQVHDGNTPFLIYVTFKDDVIKFKLPSSTTTLGAVEEEIRKRFENVGSFRLKYMDENGVLVSIIHDEHLRDYIDSSFLMNGPTLDLLMFPIPLPAEDTSLKVLQQRVAIEEETGKMETMTRITLKVSFKDDVIKFKLPSSTATLGAVEEEIRKRFENVGSFRLKYMDENGVLVSIIHDEHLRDYIDSSFMMDGPTLDLLMFPIPLPAEDHFIEGLAAKGSH